MNYRHAYHAGNFADVVKHVVLARIIAQLKLKDTAFRILDTHAGIGVYDLDAGEARRTQEADVGIQRIVEAALSPATQNVLAEYLAAVATVNNGNTVARYPGSPALARALMRHQDRLVANELHPNDHAVLADHFARDRQTKILNLDGWTALKSCLPPPERRGVTLIDPPFEQPGEFDRLVKALVDGRRRFATGIYALWYPIKDPADRTSFHNAAAATGFDEIIAVEIMIQAPTRRDVLNGAGLVVANPPYLLAEEMQKVLPELARVLGQGPGAEGRVLNLVG